MGGDALGVPPRSHVLPVWDLLTRALKMLPEPEPGAQTGQNSQWAALGTRASVSGSQPSVWKVTLCHNSPGLGSLTRELRSDCHLSPLPFWEKLGLLRYNSQ